MNKLGTEHIYRIDLAQGACCAALDAPLMHQDAQSDVITAVLRQGMTPVDLQQTGVHACFTNAAGQTILLTGTAQGSQASVTLSEACYAQPGPFTLALQLTHQDARHTVLHLQGEIRRTCTDCVLPGDDVIPTLPGLLEQLEALRSVVAEARQVIDASPTPILCSAEGTLLTLTDAAANRPLQRLTAFGQTHQESIPTPDAPQALTSVPGVFTLTMGSHNLLPVMSASKTASGLTLTRQEDGSITVEGTAAETHYTTLRLGLPAGSYFLNGCPVGGSGTTYLMYVVVDGANHYDTGAGRAFTLTEATEVNVVIKVLAGTHMAHTFHPQIVAGSRALPYVPHQGADAGVTLPLAALAGIVSADGTAVCDECDLLTGSVVQRVACVTLDGSENWQADGAAFSLDYASLPHQPAEHGMAMCTHLAPDQVSLQGMLRFSWPADSLDAFRAALAASPVTLLYPMARSVSIPFNATPRTLRTPALDSTLHAHADVPLQAVYTADTRAYVDRRTANARVQ